MGSRARSARSANMRARTIRLWAFDIAHFSTKPLTHVMFAMLSHTSEHGLLMRPAPPREAHDAVRNAPRYRRSQGRDRRMIFSIRSRPPTEAALHMNAIMSPIPTRMYKPATVTLRYTSAMTLSGGSLICLRVTDLLRAIVQPK